MMRALFLIGCVVGSVGCACMTPAPGAIAVLLDERGAEVGTAELRPAEGGVRVVIEFEGLPPGEHALHIHNVGQCHVGEGGEKSFASAGPHFNPFGKQHGRAAAGTARADLDEPARLHTDRVQQREDDAVFFMLGAQPEALGIEGQGRRNVRGQILRPYQRGELHAERLPEAFIRFLIREHLADLLLRGGDVLELGRHALGQRPQPGYLLTQRPQLSRFLRKQAAADAREEAAWSGGVRHERSV